MERSSELGLRNLVLIGMRASGKTSCGRALAEQRGCPFLDLDEELARVAGRSADSVLAEDGEPAFRDLEARVLKSAADRRGHVIATGGGAVLHGKLFADLAHTGVVIYLQASIEELLERAAQRPRPALKPLPLKAELEALLSEREALYEGFAQITIHVGRGDLILALTSALDVREGS